MATALTKTALVRQLAEKLELTNKQSAAFLDLLAETAVKETKKNGVFVIPGLCRLVKAERKARMGRNPQTGETIKIKAKTVVKFRVAKAAKDTIAPPRKQQHSCLAATPERAGVLPRPLQLQRLLPKPRPLPPHLSVREPPETPRSKSARTEPGCARYSATQARRSKA